MGKYCAANGSDIIDCPRGAEFSARIFSTNFQHEFSARAIFSTNFQRARLLYSTQIDGVALCVGRFDFIHKPSCVNLLNLPLRDVSSIREAFVFFSIRIFVTAEVMELLLLRLTIAVPSTGEQI